MIFHVRIEKKDVKTGLRVKNVTHGLLGLRFSSLKFTPQGIKLLDVINSKEQLKSDYQNSMSKPYPALSKKIRRSINSEYYHNWLC